MPPLARSPSTAYSLSDAPLPSSIPETAPACIFGRGVRFLCRTRDGRHELAGELRDGVGAAHPVDRRSA
eukprot:7231470-Prymnesium_polylepis.1